MCLKAYIQNKIGELDCRRQIEDAFIQDYCFGRNDNEQMVNYLIDKQKKEDKNLYYNFLFWMDRILWRD